MNRAEAAKLVKMAAACFPGMQDKNPMPIAYAWSVVLMDIPYQVAEKALVIVLRSAKFFPSPAEILEASKELRTEEYQIPTPEEAWENVYREIMRVGTWQKPKFIHPLVERAAKSLGWATLCNSDNLPADRAHFLRLYASFEKREEARQEVAMVAQITGIDFTKLLGGTTNGA